VRDPAVEQQGNLKGIASIVLKLLEVLAAYGLEEVEVRKGGLRCRICRSPRAAEVKEVAPPDLVPYPEPPLPTPPPESEPQGLIEVTAPMTGVFYRAPAPDAPPYVEVGSIVEKGQTLCLIEAMKVFNEIPSPVSGQVVEILAQNGALVRQGERLFRIRPSTVEEGE